MENILFKVVAKPDVVSLVEQIFKQRYHLNSHLLTQNLQELSDYLTHFRSGLSVVVEHSFIDKVYRNNINGNI